MEAKTTKIFLRTDPLEKRQAMVNTSMDELLMEMKADNIPEFHQELYDGPLRQMLLLTEKHRDIPPNDILGGLVQTAVASLSNPIYNIAKDTMPVSPARPSEIAVRVAGILGGVMEKLGDSMSDAVSRAITVEFMAARQSSTDEDCDCPACRAARASTDHTSLH